MANMLSSMVSIFLNDNYFFCGSFHKFGDTADGPYIGNAYENQTDADETSDPQRGFKGIYDYQRAEADGQKRENQSQPPKAVATAVKIQCFLEFHKAIDYNNQTHYETDTADENVVFYNKKDSDACRDQPVDHAEPIKTTVPFVRKVSDNNGETVYDQ